MAQNKTTNLLPSKFRTSPNNKFLNSAVEPLISDPELRRVNGYVGQHLTKSYRVGDGYIQEPTATRQHRQLDPTLIVYNNITDKTKLTVSYVELLDKLRYLGSTVKNESILFEQEFYNYYPHFDADKFINYAQYYWVSGGVPSVFIESSSVIFIEDILDQLNYTSPNGVVFTNGLIVRFNSLTYPIDYQNNDYYVERVGTGIKLVRVDSLVTPESFLPDQFIPYAVDGYDVGQYDTTLGFALDPDYFVINRADQSLNAWSRGNRWMHIDVIQAAGAYQKIDIDFSQFKRAVRPIIEFDPDIELFNHGVNFYGTVDFIDTVTTDPFSDANYTGIVNSLNPRLVDTVKLESGNKIIFTTAFDPNVRNKIYTVQHDFFGNPQQSRISLIAGTEVLLENSNLVVKNGSNRGLAFVYKNGIWSPAQQKVGLNQPPLFDLFDQNAKSYSDIDYYPGSTFIGTELFSYKIGNGVKDSTLGFPLSYRNIGNIGDIQFQDYINTEAFTWQDLPAGFGKPTVLGQIRKSGNLVDNWQLTANNSSQRQIFEFTVDAAMSYVIDIVPLNGKNSIEVVVNGNFLNKNDFTYDTNTKIITASSWQVGDYVGIIVISSQVSSQAYYELPINLINNADNQDVATATLGQLRNHYGSAYGYSQGGVVPSLRDQPKASLLAGTILQHSAPITPAMFFLCNSDFDFITSLEQARSAYGFFKKRFLEAASTLGTLDFNDVPLSVDIILDYISQNNSPDMPYYYSDMVAHGTQRSKITYTIFNSQQKNYGIDSIFNKTVPSPRSVLVYYKNSPWRQLVHGKDYVFETASSGITLLTELEAGGILEIRDYANTDGSYMPETPTKMGLWPATAPEIRIDRSFRDPQTVIIGHDGSRTVGFGDIRDDMLLELELRIYNNIKQQFDPAKLIWHEVCPGAFRSNGYTIDQVNQILSPYYYRWKEENNLNFSDIKFFKNSDAWTWNYYNQLARDNSRLNGSWSAVFRYWYDTVEPDTRPWEMLGYTTQPAWWENKYGPAPYTSGNTLLWDDIRDGVQTADNTITTVRNPLFARPEIYNYLPVDSQGQLKTPLELFVKLFNGAITNTSYAFGMEDPVEHAWRRSSDFAFSAQIAMAVLKPARYFALFASTTPESGNDLVPHVTPTYSFTVGPTNWTWNIARQLEYEFIVEPTVGSWEVFLPATQLFVVTPIDWTWYITLPPVPVIPSVTLGGPSCIDTTVNTSIDFTATFSNPVTGFDNTALTSAFKNLFVGLDPINITSVSPTVYNISSIRKGIPYGISNRRTANIKGSPGLSLLLQVGASAAPQGVYSSVDTRYSARDESILPITLPFNVSFPTSPTNSITGNQLWVTSNSIIYLSATEAGTGYPLRLSNPPAPAIVVGSTDGGIFNIYGGTENGGTEYRIRWEGVANFKSPAVDKIWEITFYANDPTKYSIDISPTWVAQGTSYIKNDSAQLYNLTNEIAANKGFDVSFAYQARIPFGVARATTYPNNVNLTSNLLKIAPCVITTTTTTTTTAAPGPVTTTTTLPPTTTTTTTTTAAPGSITTTTTLPPTTTTTTTTTTLPPAPPPPPPAPPPSPYAASLRVDDSLALTDTVFVVPAGTPSGTVYQYLIVGGGGAGGFTQAGKTAMARGGGGGGAVVSGTFTVSANDVITYRNGLGGASGIGGPNWNDGTNTVISVNGKTFTALGGIGNATSVNGQSSGGARFAGGTGTGKLGGGGGGAAGPGAVGSAGGDGGMGVETTIGGVVYRLGGGGGGGQVDGPGGNVAAGYGGGAGGDPQTPQPGDAGSSMSGEPGTPGTGGGGGGAAKSLSQAVLTGEGGGVGGTGRVIIYG